MCSEVVVLLASLAEWLSLLKRTNAPTQRHTCSWMAHARKTNQKYTLMSRSIMSHTCTLTVITCSLPLQCTACLLRIPSDPRQQLSTSLCWIQPTAAAAALAEAAALVINQWTELSDHIWSQLKTRFYILSSAAPCRWSFLQIIEASRENHAARLAHLYTIWLDSNLFWN